MRSVALTTARRLAVTRQRLAGPAPTAGAAGMLDVVRDLGCVQLDPIQAVAKSHQLVLWSRLGSHDPADLDALLWQERSLFEYWAHVASLVLTEHFPIHQHLMRSYYAGPATTARAVRMHDWLRENEDLRQHILAEIAARGPLASRHFEDKSRRNGYAGGWTSGRNVTEMLDYLWTRGEVAVAGRLGQQRLWDLADRHLPPWTPRDVLPEAEVVRRSAEIALRALGIARPNHIQQHFTRRRYPGLPAALADLESTGRIVPVAVHDDVQALPGPWYLHADDLPLVDRLEAGDWRPRTTLLSPFDNLICDRDRTELLWGFRYRVEIYVPPAKREYGYYVLPILHGADLIGRLDARLDRTTRTLHLPAVYAEPDTPNDVATTHAVAGAIEQLAQFVGATTIACGGVHGPPTWRRRLAAW